ncbi:vitamin D3 receptor isoform X1 [Octopus bimaculoides]|uniref:Nuclear receptor domain-containing protein n=1 Tax=Octopus bimaculoides TaxID=37653 RepID=A0A0L8FLP1_OCTBM|nr:vitamin D3 receptor isoform X1 [Octopus bimaculoides]XP_052821704.1 vitamin D3 receptor isoform X1 [Octopus bimaculoides]XP_052821705.1 vitamin D3 receptor isoform X1 [Octopus bimaculoides]XP_052821706.1 vitamin D3 receptor isoform X1 [Octopus bimaculoides]XP_052821707.1 vitamin D3 receptor isoform X1 [Octopus bimaculoides]XP_052821708.1 vitamin D3 receptor isoform X1 [Octopus bimaculoides]XP_052821709.1 vitamin D3 receptor isoform X1 [Octopus bimaculoides]XP_052821710.1 vitamin D3 recept|eukprot:XP_014788933.1 PREDICTED: vitamin D3 receptor-like isoform X1 [Octopus bimaculoides]
MTTRTDTLKPNGTSEVGTTCKQSPDIMEESSNSMPMSDQSMLLQWSDDSCEPDSSTSTQTKGNIKEQKRRPKPKDGTKLICRVCNDVALGYNFDAVTCESCKAFFRRNALKKKVFNCTFDGNCRLDPHTRKFCSSCRLKKCFAVGMKKDWILNEEQLAKRRQRLTSSQQNNTPLNNNNNNSSPSPSASSISSFEYMQPLYEDAEPALDVPNLKTWVYPADKYPVSHHLFWNTLEVSESISQTITYIRMVVQEHENTFNENYPSGAFVIPKNTKEFFVLSNVFICRLINFMKYIPDFQKLPKEDRISIFRGSIREVSLIRASMAYSYIENMWVFKDCNGDKSYLDTNILKATLGDCLYSKLAQFIRSFKIATNDDKVIMILLLLIEFFDQDKSSLLSSEVVVAAQEKYTSWLKTYIDCKYNDEIGKVLFPRVLVKLMDVREIGEICNEATQNFLLQGIDPLTAEVLDLKLMVDKIGNSP